MASVKYDEAILQELADAKYSKARFIVFVTASRYSISGAIIGFLAGIGAAQIQPPTTQPETIAIASVVLFAIGLISGIARGRTRSMNLKIEAQTLLCQMQIEKNTRRGTT